MADRSAELETNSLGQIIAALNQGSLGYILAGGAVLIITAGLAYSYLSDAASQAAAAEWKILDRGTVEARGEAGDYKTLTELIASTTDKRIEIAARTVLARCALNRGLRDMTADTKRSREDLALAVKHLDAVLAVAAQPDVVQEALMARAMAHEGLADLPKAEADYQALVEKHKDGPFFDQATARLERLKRTDVRAFYDWIAKQERTPTPPPGGLRDPGTRPEFDLDALEGGLGGGAGAGGASDGGVGDTSLAPAGLNLGNPSGAATGGTAPDGGSVTPPVAEDPTGGAAPMVPPAGSDPTSAESTGAAPAGAAPATGTGTPPAGNP